MISPVFEAAGAGTLCCGSADSAAPMAADLFGGAVIPVDMDSGRPCEGESQEGCSCDSGQPLLAELSQASGAPLPARELPGPRNPSDPSSTVSSEIFRPPLS